MNQTALTERTAPEPRQAAAASQLRRSRWASGELRHHRSVVQREVFDTPRPSEPAGLMLGNVYVVMVQNVFGKGNAK